MRFSLPFLDDFEATLNNWLEKAEILGPVYELCFVNLYQSQGSTYPRQKFLSLVQALETYHRRVFNSSELPEEDHEQRLSEILDQVPEPHRDWLQGKLAFSNEPSLRKRLKEIFQYNQKAVIQTIGKSEARNKFSDNIVKARNYLTHLDPAAKEVTNDELLEYIPKLNSLIEICLLNEIGFDGKQVEAILTRHT